MSNEPVAWMNPDYTDPRRRLETNFHFVSPETGPPDEGWIPLYTQDDTALLRRCLKLIQCSGVKHPDLIAERDQVERYLRERLKEGT